MKQKQKRLKFLLFVNLFSMVGFYMFTPLYALFVHSLDVSPRYISMIWGGYSLLLAMFLLIFGAWENTRRKSSALILGYFVCALASLSFLLVDSVESLLAVLAFNALGGGITMPAHKTLFARNEAKGKESQQWSWLDAGNMFAAAIGGFVGGVIISAFGFNGIFVAMAAIQFAAAVVAYTYLRTINN